MNCHLFFKRIYILAFFFLVIPTLKAQFACPYSLRTEIQEARCYNSAAITLFMTDNDGNPYDTTASDLSTIRFHCRNILEDTTNYSFNATFLLDEGTYIVGISAILHTHTGDATDYVLVDTTTVITVSSTYTPPHIYAITHTATTHDEFGTHPALGCENTGRCQLNIQGGTFPYTIKVIKQETNDTVKTLLFEQAPYSGTNPMRFDYRDYYTIDSLTAGNYSFLLKDSCGYEAMIANQVILSVDAAEVVTHQWFASSWDLTNYNVVRMQLTLRVVYQYYSNHICDHFHYCTLFPNGDVSNWKSLPSPSSSSGNTLTYILYDTAYNATSYCALWDTAKFVIQSISCHPTTQTFARKLSKPKVSYYMSKVQEQLLGSNIVDIPHNLCGYTTPQTVDTTYTQKYYWIYKQTGTADYHFPLPGDQPEFMHFYTIPLKWTYIDAASGRVIKEENYNDIFQAPSLNSEEVINFYGRNYDTEPLNVQIRNILSDAKGCILLDTTTRFTYQYLIQTKGGNYTPSSWSFSKHEPLPGNCCANYLRGFELCGSNLQINEIDSITIEIISSPLNNLYNSKITHYFQENRTDIHREQPGNTAEITCSTGSKSIIVIFHDYCFPSGTYTFHITTPCREYTRNYHLAFTGYSSSYIQEKPQYEIEYGCNEMKIIPTKGSFREFDKISPLIPNIGNLVSDSIPAYFQVVDGPLGGYNDQRVSLDSPLRVTIPGTYTVRMQYIGNSHSCFSEYSDTTFYYSGKQVEFEYANAYVCDSLSTEGYVHVRGIYGAKPYIYTLYSMPEKMGNMLAQNNSGDFFHIPLYSGQIISVSIQDSCGNSFYVNINVLELTKTQKAWFENGMRRSHLCEGESIQIYTLPLSDEVSYVWTGPNDFMSTSRHSQVNIARGEISGYYKVTLLHTGCHQPIQDSVWLNVIPAPRVILKSDTVVCPGEEATLTFFPFGNGNIDYTVAKEENGELSYFPYSGLEGSTQQFNYTALSDGTFWISEIKDAQCSYTHPDDSIFVTINQNIDYQQYILKIDDTVCWGEDAEILAQSVQETPYLLHWYSDPEQTHLLRTDTIHTAQYTSYQFTNLQYDTSLYVSANSLTKCENHVQTISKWLCMDTTQMILHNGERVRWYDSGGSQQHYQNNESIIQSFLVEDSTTITLTFDYFHTENDDYLYVFNSLHPSTDSIIAILGGDLENNPPTPIISSNGRMTFQFISNQRNSNIGWQATLSVGEAITAIHAEVIDTLEISLNILTSEPIEIGDTIAILAIAETIVQDFQYQWHTRTGPFSPWSLSHEQNARDSAVSFFAVNGPFLAIQVSIDNQDFNHCSYSSTAQIEAFKSDPQIHLTLSSSYSNCDSVIHIDVSIQNSGTHAIDSTYISILLPEYLDFENPNDSSIFVPYLTSNNTYTQPISILSRSVLSPAYQTIKAQITHCKQENDLWHSAYGNWDWDRANLEPDEDTLSIVLKPWIDIQTSTTCLEDSTWHCLGAHIPLDVSSSIPYPQYYHWYADSLQTDLLFSEAITEPSPSHFTLHSIQKDTTLFIEINSDSICTLSPTLKPIFLFVSMPTHDTLYYTNVQSSFPHDYDIFQNIDISTPAVIVLDTILQNQHGCDSAITLILNIVAPTPETWYATACQNYTWNGIYYNESGTYQQLFKTAEGFDSIATLELTILQTIQNDIYDTACFAYSWNESTYYQTDTYEQVFISAAGCDSVVDLHLIILPQYKDTLYDTVCQSNDFYTFQQFQSIDISEAGDFIIDSLFQSKEGCDSMVTLYLHIVPTPTIEDLQDTAFCSGQEIQISIPLGNLYENTFFQWETEDYGEHLSGFTSCDTYADTIKQTLSNYSSDVESVQYIVYGKSNGCPIKPFHLRIVVFPPTNFEFLCADTTIYLTYGQCDTILSIPWDSPYELHHNSLFPIEIENNAPLLPNLEQGDYEITWTISDRCGNSQHFPQNIHVQYHSCPDAVDYDGYHYPSVLINCNCWTSENLRSVHYSDGRLIPNRYGYYSEYFPNTTENIERYGLLYSWDAAVDSMNLNVGDEHIQGACPDGWRLPTQEEYMNIEPYGDGLRSPLYWLDGGGTNTTGFNSLPAGFFNGTTNRFERLLVSTYYWSSNTGNNPNEPIICQLNYHCDRILTSQSMKGLGYSIRCIKMTE